MFSVVTYGQPRYKNIKWQTPEINNPYALNCVPFWVEWQSLVTQLHPAWDGTQPLVQHVPPVCHGEATWVVRPTAGAAAAGAPRASGPLAPLMPRAPRWWRPQLEQTGECSFSVKSESSWLNEERKQSYAKSPATHGKKEPSTCETVKQEKDIHASFVLAPQTAKVIAMVHEKHSVKTEKP